MSLRARMDLRALNSDSVTLRDLLGRNFGRVSISCRHCRMNSSREPNWSSGGDQVDFFRIDCHQIHPFEGWRFDYENKLFGVCLN